MVKTYIFPFFSSFELLHRCFGARLLKTEMEVAYFPEGGSITDFTCEMFGTRLGVSVTRAMKFKGVFELEDAEKLLRKKLNGTPFFIIFPPPIFHRHCGLIS